jgi:hypothetical protein
MKSQSVSNGDGGNDSEVNIQLTYYQEDPAGNVCSDYCKRIGPARQHQIIRDILLKENGSDS